MVKNHKLAKAIHDVSWTEFFRQLQYKAQFTGTKVLQVDSFYPSSQICSYCGHKNPDVKNLSIRMWICPNCGAIHDRDINAAKNILQQALKKIVTQQQSHYRGAHGKLCLWKVVQVQYLTKQFFVWVLCRHLKEAGSPWLQPWGMSLESRSYQIFKMILFNNWDNLRCKHL